MKKLKLNLEDLELESFETMAAEDASVGTVNGLTIADGDSRCGSCDASCDPWEHPECGGTYWSACYCVTAANCTM
jgi:hypothetical protein